MSFFFRREEKQGFSSKRPEFPSKQRIVLSVRSSYHRGIIEFFLFTSILLCSGPVFIVVLRRLLRLHSLPLLPSSSSADAAAAATASSSSAAASFAVIFRAVAHDLLPRQQKQEL
jgi:hypothetical protein